MPNIDDKFYKVQEVADLLRVNPRTIIRFIERGELNALRIGHQYRIAEKDLKEYLDMAKLDL